MAANALSRLVNLDLSRAKLYVIFSCDQISTFELTAFVNKHMI